MADILSTGVSGLLAFQRALDTTSHNIANAATPGYSRQRVELGTRVPQPYGNGFLGSGVDVNTVTRSYDELLASQMRQSSSAWSRLDTYAGKAESLNNLFADTTTGIPASLQRFINAIQGVANTPTSVPARQVLLSEAESLADRLKSYDARLDQLDAEIDQRLGGEATAISSTAQAIAKLNEQIVSARASTGQPPNDLMDQRDRLVADLSVRIGVTTVQQDDGALNVFIGKGQPLVLGANATDVVAVRDGFDPSRMRIAFQAPGGAVDLTSSISGGSLGGLLDVRRELIDPTRNRLGQIAAGVSAAVNAQHREGMDLAGNLGQDFFAIGAVEVLPHAGNGGSGTVAVTRGAIGALTDDDYVLEYTSGGWAMRRADTGASVALAGAGTVASPFTAEGLSIVVGGAPAVGARFLVRPTAAAVDGLQVLVDDPARVAAAAPIRTAAATTNAGGAQISAGEVLDGANPALRTTATIQFLTPTTYSINGAGSFAYTGGTPIAVNGWSATISGTPAAGDTFSVASNAGGVGDNRNAQALTQVLNAGVLNGGADSLNAAAGRFVGAIGVATSQAQASRDAQQVILDDNKAALDSVSGVNLDEEAANLLRFQQAYQAAAQIIRVTQTLFDSLLDATRR